MVRSVFLETTKSSYRSEFIKTMDNTWLVWSIPLRSASEKASTVVLLGFYNAGLVGEGKMWLKRMKDLMLDTIQKI